MVSLVRPVTWTSTPYSVSKSKRKWLRRELMNLYSLDRIEGGKVLSFLSLKDKVKRQSDIPLQF